MVVTACVVSIAHGSNDVSNAVGPFTAIAHIHATGQIPRGGAAPVWVLMCGGVGIVAGLGTYGHKVMKKGVRRLEDMLHGNSAAQPNAPGVKFFPNDKGGDRANGTQFSITYRLKAYMAPTKAWQYAADSLTLKEIPDDETELETLMGEIATMLSQLDADDASKYITTTSNSSKSSTTGTEIPALTNIFLIKPSDEALRVEQDCRRRRC